LHLSNGFLLQPPRDAFSFISPHEQTLCLSTPLLRSYQNSTPEIVSRSAPSFSVQAQPVESQRGYTDYSNIPDHQVNLPLEDRNNGGVAVPFPERLHCMLMNNQDPDIVAWEPHGRSFRVLKPKRFEEEVIPTFFKQTKFRSFQRQLNLYGFQRISKGPDHGSYYHELFLRGRKGLCAHLRRLKPARSQPAQDYLVGPLPEPNFYQMPSVESESQAPIVPNSSSFNHHWDLRNFDRHELHHLEHFSSGAASSPLQLLLTAIAHNCSSR
jgi:hypothetical protein